MAPRWPGLFPLARRFLYGAQQGPRALYYRGVTPTTQEYYEGMDKFYRWFRQDELVRGCVTVNAFFACMTQGFETVLEPSEPTELPEQERKRMLKDYAYVKTKIDALNKQVNLDQILLVAQVKRAIYGKSGFEIVLDEKGVFTRLLPLSSTELKPEVNRDWKLTGFEYKGQTSFYEPEDILYFLNSALEADYEGLSDI